MHNKRNTIQRQLILDAVRELDIHATAEQVYDHVVTRHPSISKATVYRNLSQMVESEELIDIGDFYGSTHYDHNCHKHYHFICDQCEKVSDVNDCLTDICGLISGLDGYEIRGHNLSFNGLCADCKATSENQTEVFGDCPA